MRLQKLQVRKRCIALEIEMCIDPAIWQLSCAKLFSFGRNNGCFLHRTATHACNSSLFIITTNLLQMPSSLNELILQVYMPMLAENVPRDWNVSLVDAPGLGERNFHVQRLAEEALESSSAYVHLLLPESIGGKDVGEIFNSLAGKVPGMLQLNYNNGINDSVRSCPC